MKHTIKYILIQVELLVLLFVFFIGVGSADSGITFSTVCMIFGPFAYGKLTHVGKQIEWCEVYDRASRIAWNKKYPKTV